MFTNFVIRGCRPLFAAVLVFILTSVPVLAAVVGPLPPASLPGGGAIVDSDPGSGEQWGRAGGRDWDFFGLDPLLFSTLEWGPSGAGAVGIAFDGEVTGGTSEVLSFSAADSNLASGIAVWLGSTTVLTSAGVQAVDTRFVLTVTQGISPIPLQISATTGMPSVNVIAAGSSFSANLRMEARLSGGGGFSPALDLFDLLQTDPNQSESAQTSFSSGFYFEQAGGGGGLSIEEHDANMQAATAEIEGAIDFHNLEVLGNLEFHNLETVGRLTSLGEQHDGISGLLNNLFGEIQGLATVNDVNGVREALQEFQQSLLQILWGIEFDENGNPNFDTIVPISSLARTKLDLQVVHPAQASNNKTRRMLVLATEAGSMVGGVNIVAVAAINDNDFSPILINDFVATEIAPGLLQVDIPLSGSQNSIKTFLIIAEHSDHESGDSTHQGTILTTDAQ